MDPETFNSQFLGMKQEEQMEEQETFGIQDLKEQIVSFFDN
jgi:hypothetical protein